MISKQNDSYLSLAVELTPEELALAHGGGLPIIADPGSDGGIHLTAEQRKQIANTVKAVAHAAYDVGKKIIHFLGSLF